MNEQLPTEADLEAELANPIISVMVNRDGEFQRFVRWEEYCEAVRQCVNMNRPIQDWSDFLVENA